jgi:hypothetical protein
VGELPWWTHFTIWFMQVPWFAAVIVMGLAFLLAVWARIWLRATARKRLQLEDN